MSGIRKKKTLPLIDVQEKQRRLEAARSAEASLRIEGLLLDKATKDVFEMWITGKITSKEKTKRIRKLVDQLSD